MNISMHHSSKLQRYDNLTILVTLSCVYWCDRTYLYRRMITTFLLVCSTVVFVCVFMVYTWCSDASLFLYCWQIDVIEPQELTDERSRLRSLSSLTILAYIKTKFDDLMQHRLEEEKDSGSGKNKPHGHGRFNDNNGATSDFTSTFHSLDLPPEEYETQL